MIFRSWRYRLKNVVLTAVKKAEEDDAVIVRFYEWAGKETEVKLLLSSGRASSFGDGSDGETGEGYFSAGQHTDGVHEAV